MIHIHAKALFLPSRPITLVKQADRKATTFKQLQTILI